MTTHTLRCNRVQALEALEEKWWWRDIGRVIFQSGYYVSVSGLRHGSSFSFCLSCIDHHQGKDTKLDISKLILLHVGTLPCVSPNSKNVLCLLLVPDPFCVESVYSACLSFGCFSMQVRLIKDTKMAIKANLIVYLSMIVLVFPCWENRQLQEMDESQLHNHVVKAAHHYVCD